MAIAPIVGLVRSFNCGFNPTEISLPLLYTQPILFQLIGLSANLPLTNKRVGKVLLALIMLAKRAKDQNALGIGPWKLVHSALDNLKES